MTPDIHVTNASHESKIRTAQLKEHIMVHSSSDRDPVEALAEEFMARRRAGEYPSIDAYAGAHPDLADEIRDLFSRLLMMEEYKPAADSSADSAAMAWTRCATS